MRELRGQVPRRRLALGLGAILGIGAVVALGIFAFARSTESSLETVALDGVSAGDLAKNGVVLAAPSSDYAAAITARDATAAVAKYNPDAIVKQVVLARVVNEVAGPKMDRVLWVPNLDVEGKVIGIHGPPGTVESVPYLYSLIFVDPATGIVLGEISLGGTR